MLDERFNSIDLLSGMECLYKNTFNNTILGSEFDTSASNVGTVTVDTSIGKGTLKFSTGANLGESSRIETALKFKTGNYNQLLIKFKGLYTTVATAEEITLRFGVKLDDNNSVYFGNYDDVNLASRPKYEGVEVSPDIELAPVTDLLSAKDYCLLIQDDTVDFIIDGKTVAFTPIADGEAYVLILASSKGTNQSVYLDALEIYGR